MRVTSAVDVVDIERFARMVSLRGSALLGTVFTVPELADAKGRLAHLAGRFAAKEAMAKVLGTGIGPVGWHDLEVASEPSGRPTVHLHGAAAEHASSMHLDAWCVGLSYEGPYAVAIVTATRDDPTHG